MAQSISQEAIGATGLPGATAASRHAGATALGAPTSGTFAMGDYVVDQSGAMYVCTVAGTPGTWQLSGVSVKENIAGKNLLINGGMDITQRGTSVTVGANTQGVYTLDRWQLYLNGGAGAATVTQNTSVVPNTIPKSLKVAVTTADPTPSGSLYILRQFIEADNLAPSMWGTPSAQAITFSFWVYTNLTGTFGFSINNYASSRFYVTQYTVNTANTWQYITVTIPGDTATGYWNLNGNGGSASINFDMGSTYGQTTSTYANAWNAGSSWSIVGNQKVITSTSNVFYVTGVQMEIAPQATPFSRAGGSIGGELALCQRYFEMSFAQGTTPANGSSTTTVATTVGMWGGSGSNVSPNYPSGFIPFKVEKRTASYTVTSYGNSLGYWGYGIGPGTPTFSSSVVAFYNYSTNGIGISNQAINATMVSMFGHWTVSAEL